ncbi:hypothetical protein HDE69_004821 [Pedobacter cryoconitis]|uniref:Uncharacterized protein n=1 Tax=Pedobacter cryoconitis TaxID=188932 RepID=A0A7W8YXP1_9SPHI|nr:hypothetical protein [Pedobacter cryoconitis]MBB5623734.1 hypothetical protein [Pedobacter cryoconitis]
MAQFAPHFNLYKIIGRFRIVIDITFWVIFALSIVPTILKSMDIQLIFDDFLNIINIVSLLVYFILENIVDLFLIPQAEHKRRDDFIDNSFDTKFAVNNSIGYFDNDEVSHGLYKAATNLFQNCFTTYSLIKLLTPIKIITPAIVLIAVCVMAYYGFQEVPFFLSILQIFFSANLLGALVKHLILLQRLSEIHDDWITLFQTAGFDSNSTTFNTQIFRNWLRYETLVTKIPASIPDKFFHKHNQRITSEWLALKVKYSIQ